MKAKTKLGLSPFVSMDKLSLKNKSMLKNSTLELTVIFFSLTCLLFKDTLKPY